MNPVYPPAENVADFSPPSQPTSDLADLSRRVSDLERRNIRLGPKPPWDDAEWIEEGNRLAEAIVAEAQRRLEKPMAVRSKVRCTSNVNGTVCFTTVYEPDASKDTENARFTKATPWGDIRLGIDNPAAAEQFQPNKEYYVDFTPAG